MPGTTGDGPSAQEIEVEAAARHLGLTAVASAPPSTEGFALAVGRRASVPEPPARDWSARPAGGHGP
ncbi:hypothetical protein [Puerhibacterium puerhi]|uniref:hypothetical protein n=1 Tax=Puerhibacterium puerhi TaxID=2692623 RepID=UPI00135A774D|nr:hypothetical protein [Puerhibacterium puerhi]